MNDHSESVPVSLTYKSGNEQSLSPSPPRTLKQKIKFIIRHLPVDADVKVDLWNRLLELQGLEANLATEGHNARLKLAGLEQMRNSLERRKTSRASYISREVRGTTINEDRDVVAKARKTSKPARKPTPSARNLKSVTRYANGAVHSVRMSRIWSLHANIDRSEKSLEERERQAQDAHMRSQARRDRAARLKAALSNEVKQIMKTSERKGQAPARAATATPPPSTTPADAQDITQTCSDNGDGDYDADHELDAAAPPTTEPDADAASVTAAFGSVADDQDTGDSLHLVNRTAAVAKREAALAQLERVLRVKEAVVEERARALVGSAARIAGWLKRKRGGSWGGSGECVADGRVGAKRARGRRA